MNKPVINYQITAVYYGLIFIQRLLLKQHSFHLSSLVRQCCKEHFGTACSPLLISQPKGLCRDVGEQHCCHSPSHPLCASHLSALEASLQKPSVHCKTIYQSYCCRYYQQYYFSAKELAVIFFNLTIDSKTFSTKSCYKQKF